MGLKSPLPFFERKLEHQVDKKTAAKKAIFLYRRKAEKGKKNHIEICLFFVAYIFWFWFLQGKSNCIDRYVHKGMGKEKNRNTETDGS